jgi:hypothetical protein
MQGNLICDQRDLRSAQAAVRGVYTKIQPGLFKFLSSLIVLRCSSMANYSEGQRIIHIEGSRGDLLYVAHTLLDVR